MRASGMNWAKLKFNGLWLLSATWFMVSGAVLIPAVVLRPAAAQAQTVDGRKVEADHLLQQGLQQFQTSQFEAAFQSWQQALQLYRAIKDRRGEGKALGNLGLAYSALGNYAKAIDYHGQSLAIAREIKDRLGEGKALGNLGLAYDALGHYAKAIEYQEQRLAIAREIKDRLGEGKALGNLGLAYYVLGNYAKAIDYHEQHLAIAREIKDRLGEGNALSGLGIAYYVLGNYAKAIDYHEQHLAIAREIKDREGEGIGLSNLGITLAKQQQPELAIIFYKQSVSVRETIRGDLRTLPRELQESYTQTVADTYRALADLLLAQGRVLEAQQVLELLKIQELRNYTRDTRAGGETKGAPLNAIEAPVVPPFDHLIALGIKLTTCEGQKPYCGERDQLRNQRDQATAQFNQQADRLRTLARQGRDKDPAQLQQEELTVAAYKIVQAQPKTVLIYPLVLEDKLWLVYGLQAGKQGVVFASKEIPVKRKDLAATVTKFRQLLEDPNSNLKQLQQVSQKLYGWLVAPLRPQLDANGIQNLVFSLDRSTRYLPLAALHDGKQYLAQRFSLSTILTAGLTDTQDKLSKNLADNPVLGLGLSNAAAGFSALPNVVDELNAIVRTSKPNSQGSFPGTERLNGDFTLKAFKDILDYRILHLATHGKFDSEDPEKSFLVLGDGSPLKVTDIKNMNDLGGIHLVVLSACETAQGGPDKEGIEVSGLSYYFLTQNVKSVMASLWKVNDASTSRLMQQFYQNLATGKMSKAEALRQAQLAMISGKGMGGDGDDRRSVGGDRGNFRIETTSDGKTPAITRNLSHPYYWAPFILIGNGL
jgi:CHAT domain-containing protein